MDIGKEYDHLIERIYAKHMDVIKKLMRKGVEEHEAPDLAVKAMLTAIDKLSSLEDEDKLEGWLMAIAENTANQYFNERNTRWKREITSKYNAEAGEEIGALDDLIDEKSAEKIVLLAEERKLLNTVLDCLNDTERAVFYRRSIDKDKFRIIAEDLGMNINTVKSMYIRSCDKLKEYSEKLYGKEAYYD